MNREILNEYMDACALVKETEKDIAQLKKRKKTVVTSSVKGSMNGFPYTETHFKTEGTAYTYSDDVNLRAEEKLLEERKAKADAVRAAVEEWMTGIPMRMQRIIRYHFFDGLSWEETAERIGRKATGESIKKEFQRFTKKSESLS